MSAPRTYVGRDQNVGGIIRVFTLPDALEIDEISFVEIERTRVYFDDVLALTYHRARNPAILIIMGIALALTGIPALLLAGKAGEAPGAIILSIFAFPFLVTFVVHLVFGTDFITIYGRRTMARMRFRIRKGRAREVFQQLAARIRAAQATAAAAAAEAAARAAPPASPELPPGPPAPPVVADPDQPPPA